MRLRGPTRTGVPVAAFLALGLTAGAREKPADLVLVNAEVYTLDAARSWASSLAVRDGLLVHVGDEAGARRLVGRHTRVVDLGGRFVLPGFRDSHVHLLEGGLQLESCDLSAPSSREALEAAVAACAAARPDQPWLTGGGWQLTLFPEGNPGRGLLDRLVPDRPALLEAADGHSAWVNTRALEQAGVRRETPDPPSGRIERDPATGEPSGTLRETAIALVSARVPPPTPADLRRGLERGLREAARLGIVAVHDPKVSPEQLAAYAEADRAGRLSVRVAAALLTDPAAGPAQVDELVRLRRRFGGRRLRPVAAKLFLDGVIEARTAALLEPYLGGAAGDRGELRWSEALLSDTVAALDRAGFQLHLHAIGDRAVRAGLDALAEARRRNGPRDARPLMAHLQLIDPADLGRFRALGVAASFQALWAYADTYITELTLPRLGPERSRWIYPIASVAHTGAILAGGSDWSVSSLNPLDAIEVGLTRRAVGQSDGPAFVPEERLDLASLLASYTVGGAWAAGEERQRGSLQPGRAADLVVLDRNLFDQPAWKLHEARVLLTLLDGRETYRDASFPSTTR